MAKLNIQDYYKNVASGNPYALSTDAQSIKSMYDRATAAAQAVEERGIANAEAAWQRNLAGTQATALDTIRKNNASAIATGASKGMQAANELSAVLGLQDTAVEESTALAQQRLDLADAYAAEYAKNAVTAQETADANRQAMMNAAMQQYGYDTEYAAQELLSQSNIESAKYSNQSLGALYRADDLEAQAKALADDDPNKAILNQRAENLRIAAGVADGAYETESVDPKVLSVGKDISIGGTTYKTQAKVTNPTIISALDERGIDAGTAVKYNNIWYVKGKGGTYYSTTT